MSLIVNRGLGDTGLSVNTDSWMGLVYGVGTLLAAWTDKEIKNITSLAEAESLLILPTSADNQIKALYYHLEKFFSASPSGIVGLMLTNTIANSDIALFDKRFQTIGFVNNTEVVDTAGLETLITGLQTQVNTIIATSKPIKFIQVILSTGISNLADFTQLPDFEANGTSSNVTHIVGQDNTDGSLGKEVFDSAAGFCGLIGLALGIISKRGVHNSMHETSVNSLAQYGIQEVIIPTTAKEDVKGLTQTNDEIIANKGHVCVSFDRYDNLVFKSSRNCTKKSSSRANLMDCRTENKVDRLVAEVMNNKVVGRSIFNQIDGSISLKVAAEIESEAAKVIDENMLRGKSEDEKELNYESGSFDEKDFVINREENVQATKIVKSTLKVRSRTAVDGVVIDSVVSIPTN